MFLDKFVREFRDYMSATDLIVDFFPDSLNRYEKLIIDKDTISKLEELEVNLQYMEGNIDLIIKEIDSLYDKVEDKIDRLVQLAEGYQKINTKEVSDLSIRNFNIFNIKNKEYYDPYLDSITLKRNTSVRSLKAISKEAASKNATERFRIPSGKIELLAKVNILNESNTILKRIVCLSKAKEELLSTTKLNFEIPAETYEIIVTTDNIDPNRINYTCIDLLSNSFSSSARFSFEDKTLKKEGKKLKFVIDKEIPTDCYITGHLNIRYEGVNENCYFNLGFGREVIVPHKEGRGDLKDLYQNKINLTSSEEKGLVISPEYSSNEDVIKYLGNGVFDISKINSPEFTVGLSFYLYSLTNKTKTPEIKSVFCYLSD